MAGLKKPSLLSNHSSNSPYKSLYVNPLNDLGSAASGANKENMAPKMMPSKAKKPNSPVFKASNTKLALRPSSLQLCMKLDDPESLLGAPRLVSSSSEAWDFSDSEAAPASSWSVCCSWCTNRRGKGDRIGNWLLLGIDDETGGQSSY